MAPSAFIPHRSPPPAGAPDLVDELRHFRDHERSHRARFSAGLDARGVGRCRSYHLCGVGGAILGFVTGLFGRDAISATYLAVERVVLRHLHGQVTALDSKDAAAAAALRLILAEEQEHHDTCAAHLGTGSWWTRIIDPIVAASTEAVIWLGMRL